MEDSSGRDRNEVYSKRVKAGKRTYFFDVKATRANDYYLTITESKRRMDDEGVSFEKHKLFLYKEDFDKFETALLGTLKHIKDEFQLSKKAFKRAIGRLLKEEKIEMYENYIEKK